MQKKEARLLADAGALLTPIVRRIEGRWIVELPGRHPLNPVLESTRGGPRRFKSLDAAAETLFDIGFKTLTADREHDENAMSSPSESQQSMHP